MSKPVDSKNLIVGCVFIAIVFIFAIYLFLPHRSQSGSLLTQGLGSKALEVRQAIQGGDYEEATRLLEIVKALTRTDTLYYTPYQTFVGDVIPVRDAAFLNDLNRWVDAEPNSGLAYSVRGNFFYNMAWTIRGNGWAKDVTKEAWQAYSYDLTMAAKDILEAEKLDGTNPNDAKLMLSIAFDMGSDDATRQWQQQLFEAQAKKYPDFYPLYQARLAQLTPRWGGSIEAMQNFVHRYTVDLSPQSLRHLLPLALVRAKLDDMRDGTAISDANAQKTRLANMVNGQEATAAIQEMLNLQKALGSSQFNSVFIVTMNEIIDDEQYMLADKILKMAAPAMGNGNYAYDQIMGYRFMAPANKAFYPQAEQSYLKALKQMGETQFPDNWARNANLAGIHSSLMYLYKRMERYDDAISHGLMSVALDDLWSTPYQALCGSYFLRGEHVGNEGDFNSAVEYCSYGMRISDHYNLHYWRAKANLFLGKGKSATQDIEAALLLHPDQNTRVDLMNMQAFVFDRTGQSRKTLDFYKMHPELLEERQSRGNLATAYATLCSALNNTKQYDKALMACTQSLTYRDSAVIRQLQQEVAGKVKRGKK